MENLLVSRSGSLTDSRRKFLEKAGLSLALGTFGVAFFTSCTSMDDSDPTIPSGDSGNGITIKGNSITVNLSIQTALNTSGNWILIENVKVLLANVNGSFVALTSVCTHSGCDRNWTFGNNRFTCTCHGSEFDPSGRVLNGPATLPLTQFTVKRVGDLVTVTA